MKFDDIKPYVRYAKILNMTEDYSTKDFRAYDNRLLYFFSSGAELIVDGTVFRPNRGELFIWTPDSVYSLTAVSPEGFTVLVVNFDYTFTERQISLCIPPVPQNAYLPEKRLETVVFSDMLEFNSPVHIVDMHASEYDFHCLDSEFVSPQRNYAAMLSAILQKLLITVVRHATAIAGESSASLVKNIIEYIHENIAKELSNTEIGQHFSYHPNYLNRCMLASTGQSLHQYVVNARILKALELLQTTDLSVTDISRAVGFRSIKHFSQSFKRAYGCSPTHFR